MTCRVLREPDQHALYDALVGCLRHGASCAVLDPAWPTELAAAAERAVAERPVPPRSLVLFTSGSSGRPRAVVRSLASWQASLDAVTQITGISGRDTVWLPGPLWSTLSLYGAFHAWSVGARVLLADDDPAAATSVHCVPTVLRRLPASDLPALRRVVVAGEPLPGSVRAAAADRGWRVVEYYGAAELSFVGWRADGGPFAPFPGVDVRVTEGQVWVRSAYLADGYLEGAGADGGGPLRRDGAWATVGDRGVAVDGGFLLAGRGDAVTTGGHTVVLGEVEAALRQVPGVREVAVVGLPHPRLGQVPVAVVAGDATVADLRRACSALPAPARPRRFVSVAQLPRTSAGKVSRAEVASLVPR
ncbi:MAG TPA: fatty acid--CoA ligase family protein [Dermatophilaceae bacterium]|nr:fatty acid--CoA ligase family protein [Dermatophilaceae bacterium]